MRWFGEIFFINLIFFSKKIPLLSQCWHKVENDSQDHFYCLFSVKTLKFCPDKTKLMVFQPLKKSPLEKNQSPIEAQNPHEAVGLANALINVSID